MGDNNEVSKSNPMAAGSSSSSTKRPYQKRKANVLNSEAPLPRAMNISMVQFLFSKKLCKSDVTRSQNRIILPTKQAKRLFPECANNEVHTYFMDDMDAVKVWTFFLRSWPNNGSRKYVLEGTARYVEEHGIKEGDHIMMYKDHLFDRFAIGFQKEGEDTDNNPPASGEQNVYLPERSPDVAMTSEDYYPQFAPYLDETFPSIDDKVDPEYVEKNFNMSWDDFLGFNPFDDDFPPK